LSDDAVLVKSRVFIFAHHNLIIETLNSEETIHQIKTSLAQHCCFDLLPNRSSAVIYSSLDYAD